MTAPLDLEAIKRRVALCTGEQNVRPMPGYPTIARTTEPGSVFYRSQSADIDAHLDRRDLIAEVERLTAMIAEVDRPRARIRDLHLWAVQKWSDSEIRQKFPLARDEYGPYCPVCLAGQGREHQEHRAGCEWMLLFQE